MRNKTYLFILLILASCSTQRLATSPNLTLVPLNNGTKLSDKYEVRVDYKGLKNQNYEFKVFIRNKSNDSIFVNPASFTYRLISGKNETDPQIIYRINPEERIKQLTILADTLKNEKNPYSLTDKSTKEIVKEGLIRGTIGALLGQNAEDLEEQRLEDEDDWEQKHNLQLNKINNELHFWNNDAFISRTVPPNNETDGSILFPVSWETEEIEIEIPIQNELYIVGFKQSS